MVPSEPVATTYGRTPEDRAVRASDREREAVVDRLRRHAADGRLTVDELEERTEHAYAARTRAELARLSEDLPHGDRNHGERSTAPARRAFPGHLRAYLLVSLLLIGVWAATGAGYFWPLWPMLGWGLGVAKHGRAARRVVTPCGWGARRPTLPAGHQRGC